ncbi:MAG: hypothetical protein RMJ98_12615 [Myxococcales bacterium]|nr:hypothetical protein [Polyangiaceae bacterium]MDW8250129.1 hypothetical protein [Myxococcales bacterium]
MRRLLPLSLVSLVGLLAKVLSSWCEGRTPLPSSPPSSAPLSVDDTVGAILWTRPREATPGTSERSFWLDQAGHLLRSESGIFLHVPPRTLRLVLETTQSPVPPCPRGNTPFPLRILQRVILEDEQGMRTVVIPEAQDEPAEEFHYPLAGLGAWIFLRTERIEDPCAEPPRYIASFRVLQVTPTGVELVPGHMGSAPHAQLRADAARQIHARLGHLAKIRPEELQITLIVPHLSPAGPGWLVQLTAPVPWEFSFGGWGSETASVLLPGARPSWFPDDVAFPAVALRFAREHPSLEIVGASALPP